VVTGERVCVFLCPPALQNCTSDLQKNFECANFLLISLIFRKKLSQKITLFHLSETELQDTGLEDTRTDWLWKDDQA